MELLTALAIGLLFAVGVFQMMRRNTMRSAIGLIILGNAINLFLLSTGAYDGVVPAYTTATGVRSDALPQALVLTAVVIGMGAVAFVLSLLVIISARYETSDMDDVAGLRN